MLRRTEVLGFGLVIVPFPIPVPLPPPPAKDNPKLIRNKIVSKTLLTLAIVLPPLISL